MCSSNGTDQVRKRTFKRRKKNPSIHSQQVKKRGKKQTLRHYFGLCEPLLCHLSFQRYSQTAASCLWAPRPLYRWQTNRARSRPASPRMHTCWHTHRNKRHCGVFKPARTNNTCYDTSSKKNIESLKWKTVSHTHTHTLSLWWVDKQREAYQAARRTLIWFYCEGGSTRRAVSVCLYVCVCVCVYCNLSPRITTRGWGCIAAIDDGPREGEGGNWERKRQKSKEERQKKQGKETKNN